ncbi:MAG: winged helix-turn-helix domain-containing protein [Thermoproteota archaeon]|jgi:DNA-binding transcriptional ArsR family regulator|nr:winged helix-turn-helix domain-containing protein [Thermoproteota archaeon]
MLDPDARRLLWFLFAGSRGGENRIKIIDFLKKRPYNINQLADALGVDYKLVQHHIGVLERNNMVTKAGEKYAVLYFISNYLEANIEAFNEIQAAIEKQNKSGKK